MARHEALFWRKAANWGATKAPEWFAHYSPPLIGWLAAAAVPAARHTVRANLERIRGDASFVQNTRETLATFGTYAASLSEALALGTGDVSRAPRARLLDERHLDDAIGKGRGVILVTAHTAGWDVIGPFFRRHHDLDLVLVTSAEPDAEAGRFHDDARRSAGVKIVHVGDPLAPVGLLQHLKGGGGVALQIDRQQPGIRTRPVTILGQPGAIPEGPLKLAQLTGAPIVPIFSERHGFRDYRVHTEAARWLPRRATEADLDAVAQHLADAMTRFLRAHPTQWFHFQR